VIYSLDVVLLKAQSRILRDTNFQVEETSHLPSCDTLCREALRKYAMLGILSAETSCGSAGWPLARGDVHDLVSLELRQPWAG